MEKIIIQNLKCGGCVNTIQQKIGDLSFVQEVSVDKDSSTVTLSLTDHSKLKDVKNVLSKLGYPEENEANSISKKAKSFVSCAVGKMP